MKPRSLILFTAGVAVILGSAIHATPAEAQGRTAVRVVPRRSVVVRSYYYRPLFYDPWYRYGSPWYPDPYYYGAQRYYDMSASLRIQVTPRQTEVFLDGYFAGTVDDFDGIFQRLNVEPGEHEVELYLPGHRSVTRRVYLQPGRSSNIRLSMEPLAPGEAEPVRPAGPSVRVDRPRSAGPGPRRDPDIIRRDPRDRDDRAGSRRPDAGVGDAADADSGSLSLRVQPGDTSILIDGEQWDGPQDDERLVLELSVGRHVIVVEKEGYRRYTTEVTVRPGDAATVNISLTPQSPSAAFLR